jgi:3-hydroxybutyryl-CoA dehydratase
MDNFKINDGFTKTFTVTDYIYNSFTDIFDDKNPLHTNDKFAITHGFKARVMHGNILNGFISYFVGECLPCKNVIIHTQEIAFKQPVYLNDRLFFEAKVTAIYEAVRAIEFKFTFKNNDLIVVSKGKIQIGLLV